MLPRATDLLRDIATTVLLVLVVASWSASGLVAAFAAAPSDQHLQASSAPDVPVGPEGALGQGQLDAAAASAKADWQDARPSADLSGLSFSIADLGGLELGASGGSNVTVDVDAAGWGWSRMDLTTVVRHEIGHALGVPHGSGLMSPTLSPGESHTVTADYAEPAPEPEPEPAPPADETPAEQPATDTSAGSGAEPAETSGGTTTDPEPSTSDGPASGDGGGADSTGSNDETSTSTGTGSGAGTADESGGGSGVDAGSDAPVLGGDEADLRFEMMSLLSSLTADGGGGADIITITDNGDGSYNVTVNGGTPVVVSGTDTITIDGLGGSDTLIAPDKAGTWKITSINGGSYTIASGPTFEFSHVENLTGAATAAETFRFSDHTGVTGLIDDGTGQLTIAVGDFIKVTGDYDFVQEARTLTVVGTDAGSTATNVLKLGGTNGSGFVGVEVELLDSRLGFLGDIVDFALAIITNETGTQAWHVFDGTIENPALGDLLGLDLDLGLDSLQIAMNGTSENGSHLNLSGTPITVTGSTKTLQFTGAQVSASAPVTFDLGDVLHLNGTLTLTKGGITSVDLNTGLTAATGGASSIDTVTVVTSDPVDGTTLGRSADYSKLWNLQVSALQFAFTAANAFIGTNFDWNDANADDVLQSTEVGPDAMGLFAGGINLIFVMLTPIGGMPTQKRFLGLKGYVAEVGLVGLEPYLILTAEDVEFEANLGTTLETGLGATSVAVVDWVSSFPDPNTADDPPDGTEDPTPEGYRVFIGGVDPPAVYIDATDSVVGVSSRLVTISISHFVHISGGFSFISGGHTAVDVSTGGLTDLEEGNLAGAVPGDPVTEDPTDGSLASSADGSTIFNLPVRTFLLGISNGSIFVGYNADEFDLGSDDILQDTDLHEDAIGLLASDIDLGLVLATVEGNPVPGWKFPTFVSLKATIASLLPIGLPDEFVLAFHGITLSVNRAGQLSKGSPVGVPVLGSRAWVDWEASFPGEGGGDPGLEVPTGGDPVLIDFDDPILGISVTRLVLAISDFVYITGGFSLQVGGIEEVDVETRNLGLGGTTLATTINGTNGDQATDPGAGNIGATSNASMIWNVPVTTTMFGISDASIFIGYNPNAEGTAGTSFNTGSDSTLDEADLHADAFGFLANHINIGLVFATVDRTIGTWAASLPRFWSLKASIGLLTPVGLPSEFVLRFEGIVLSLNRGGPYLGSPLSTLWVDWTQSFPDPDGADTVGTPEVENPIPAGLAVPTGNDENPVYIDFTDPIFGISATNVKLAISDFVFVSGGFAFESGARENVDVDTAGLGLGGTTLATSINGIGGAQATDPGAGVIGATANASTIWNLPVVTTLLGISHASIFLGYNPNAAGTSGTSFNTGTDLVLDQADLSPDAIGFLASNIDIGLVFANVDKDPTKLWMNGIPNFWALKATVGFMAPIGLPSEFVLTFEGIQLTLNRGGLVNAIAQSEAWVNWTKSYPDPDGVDDEETETVVEGPIPAGLKVPTGTGNTPVYIDFDDPIFGISATRVTIALSDFVFVTGGFAFQQGGRENVDISTGGLIPGAASAYALSIGISATDPTDGSTKATATGSDLWNVPVVTTLIGVSNASIFVGYNPNEPGTAGTSFDTGEDGVLDEEDLSDGAIGLLANGITVGIVLAKVEPISTATWDDALPTFFAVRATIALLTPVGLPDDLVFRFEGVGLSMNRGGAITGVASEAWIDWQHSFPAATGDPEGLQIPTGLGNDPVTIDFDDPIIGVEAERVTISIIGFVHIAGGFAFEKGGIETVVLNTGVDSDTLSDIPSCTALTASLGAAKLADVGLDWELSADCSTITDVDIDTIKLGVFNASIFLGYNPLPADGTTLFTDLNGDNNLDREELSDDAIGFLASGVTLGFVLSSIRPSQLANVLGQPKFYTVKAHADFLGLVGLEDDFILEAEDVHIEANLGSRWTPLPSAAVAPSINWDASFTDGYEVETGGANPPVVMDYTGFLIGGGVSQFTLKISEFVYIAGSFYFEYGAVVSMPMTAGIIDLSMLAELDPTGTLDGFVGCPAAEPDCDSSKLLQVMTIGAEDVHAFVGAKGPYWFDADGDGEIDRNPVGHPQAGQIVDAEVDSDAVGLVIDDLDFALALFTPVDRLDPTRFIALQASAAKVALVGIEGLTAQGTNINVELNISTPTLSGFPILPVIDFDAYAHRNCPETGTCPEADIDPFGVKIAAPDSITGDAPVKEFTYDSLLIKASIGDIDLDVFGVLAMRGSVALELGPRADLTLTNGTVVTGATTLKFGGANLLGFVGIDGPSWTEDVDGNVVWVESDGTTPCTPGPSTDCEIVLNPDAVGLAITDLDFGIFIGLKAAPLNPGVYVAADVRIDAFGLVGLPSGFTAGGTLAVALNLGVGLAGLRGVNFKTTFGSTDPDGDEETEETSESECTTENPSTSADYDCDNAEGLFIPTGNPDNPILIDFDTTFLSVELAGTITIGSYAALVGVFYLDISEDGVKALVLADLRIGPDIGDPDPLIKAGALGVLIIDSEGIAADLNVDISIGNDDIGLALTGTARLLINTRLADASLEVPDTLWGFFTDLRNGVSPTGGTLPEAIADPSSMTGTFLSRLVDCDTPTGPDDGNDDDNRCYVISGKAPKLITGSAVDQNTINALLGRGGTVALDPTASAYVAVVIDGSINVLNFAEATGLVGISLRAGAFEMVVDVTFRLGASSSTAINVHAEGILGLYDDGVFFRVNVTINANLLSLFDLNVSGVIEIDTTVNDGTARDQYFHLAVSGSVRVLKVITLTGSLDIAVSDSKWAVQASLGARFGPIGLNADGFILSTGTFAFNLSGSIDLTIAGTGIEGYISAHASFCNRTGTGETRKTCLDERDPTDADFGANPTTRTFLIEFGGGVDVKLFGITLAGADIFFSGEAGLNGRITVRARFSVKILFVRKSVTITIADFYLPIVLVNEGAPPPRLATLETGGVLRLNVGSRADQRLARPTATAEDYIIKNNGGGSYTIYALGEEETFTGVTSIVGDFGSDSDSFVAFNELNIPATIYGGAGNDFLAYSSGSTSCVAGTTQTTLYGGDGDDDLRGGACIDAIYGEAGNDYLDGGASIDTLDGADGDDTFFGYLTDTVGENITAGAGTDTFELIGTPASDTLGLGTSGSAARITYGTSHLDLTGFERLTLRTQGGDHLTLTGALNTVGVQQVTVAFGSAYTAPDETTACDRSTEESAASAACTDTVEVLGGVDDVTINLSATGDIANIRGGQEAPAAVLSRGAGAVQVVDDPTAVQDPVSTTHVTWVDHFELIVSGSSLDTGDRDELVVNTLGGGDQLRITSLATSTTIDSGAGDDSFLIGSHALTGNTTGVLDQVLAPLVVTGGTGTDTVDVDDSGDSTNNTGTLTGTKLTGLGMHSEGLSYSGVEVLGITLGSGDDNFTVESTSSITVTTIHAGLGADTLTIKTVSGPTSVYGDGGNDTFKVGSLAPGSGGVLEQIVAFLRISGGAGTDSATLDDTGDITGDIGYVTNSRIAGLGMTIDAGHTAAKPAWSITLRNVVGGRFHLEIGGATIGTFSYNIRPLALQDAINSVLGAGTVTVTRSSIDRVSGITFLIRWVGSFTGAPPAVVATDVDLVAATGLTKSITTAAMSNGYIDYDTFETLALGLGSGDDLVDVDSTQTGTTGLTTVSAGPGDDVLTIETTSGPTTINGGSGADSLSVNALLDPSGTTNGIAGGTSGTGNVLRLVGGLGGDTYTIAVFSTGDSRINVADGEDDGESNVLNVLGTNGADVFLLRAGLVAALNTPLTGTTGIQKSFGHAELITYDNLVNGGLSLSTLDGDDVVALDDNSTTTVINGGNGNDSFFVGQIYGDVVTFNSEFTPVFTDTTRGQLTNGVSEATTINGGAGNDLFSILRNVAALQLNGEAGDDTFVIRTFLHESDPTSDAGSNVSTGSGNDLVTYVMNAPVSVDGGDGFDTLVLIGTEADDIFVVSKNGLWGAGRFVSFVGIEKVDVDGAEGDDLFVVVSTSPTVQTRIFGGLGSDTILVGAAAPIAVADDLQGHSGIIEHSVGSTLGNWTGIPVDGVGTEITDNDEPAVVMTPTGTGTITREAGTVVDTYTIRLTRTPSSDVRITVSAPLLSPDDEDNGTRTVLVSFDGITWARSATATFNSGTMSRTVYVKAIDDLALENDRFVVLQHLVVQTGGSHEYDGLVLANAVVRVIDNDQPAVTLVADEPVRVVEGGPTGSYQVNLATTPAGTVVVRVTAGPQTRVSLDGTTWTQFVDLTFTAANLPQTVFVQGFNDATVEGSAYDLITHTVLSGDGAGYTAGMAIAPISVLVEDNDTPSVRIIESDGGTHVVEAGDNDSYQVVLNANPCAGLAAGTPCTVTVRATAMPTGTRNGPMSTIRNDIQVQVSLNGTDWFDSVALTFDGTNWSSAQTVHVRAVDDSYIDGSDYQAFAPTSISRVNQIQGPLSVFGGENPDAAYTLPAPYMLPGEQSAQLVTTPNPAFDVIESKQVDTLVVDNGNSVAADTSVLTSSHLTGLGMGGDRVIGGLTIAGGITYGALESLVIHLGKGQDDFTVLSTHSGRTQITGGTGNDEFTVNTIGGVTRIDGDAGNDSFSIGDAGLLDHLGALLVLAGGAGTDTATLDDSDETDNQLGTITPETVTGLDMVALAGLDKIYSVTVRGTGDFTITLAGIGSTTLAKTATAEQVRAALQLLLFPNANSCGLAAGDPAGSTPAQDSRCSKSVYVWRDGNTFLIGFTGEYAGAAGPMLTTSMTDMARMDGVNYYGLENLTLNLGSGDDGINVRGTSAHTWVNAGAGDDLVFVSDSANLGNLDGVLNAVDLSRLLAALTAAASTRDVEALFATLLHSPLTIDDLVYTGSLDLVNGALDIDTGEGSNTLAVSDRFDTNADGSFLITNNAITGLSAGAIGYTSTGGDLAGQGYWNQAADSGLFGRGISIFLGSGGNTGRIASVRGGALGTSPFGATITTVYTGEGNDTVTIGANLPAAGPARLVVHGQTGNDSIMTDATATQPVILFGDAGIDTLGGGAADDLLFGDSGRVYYLLPAGTTDAFGIALGGAPVNGHLSNPRGGTVTGDAQFLTLDVLRTADTSIGTGDFLYGRAGNDILLGGKGTDRVDGDTGNDLLFGDFGWVGALSATSFVDTAQLPMSMPLALHPFDFVSVDSTDANGGNDTINGGDGNDIALGQQGVDTMSGGAGDDDLIGGHNVLGGLDMGDIITGGADDDVILGDNGLVYRTGSPVTTLVRLLLGTRLYLLDTATGTFYYSGNTVGTVAQANPTGVETRAITIYDHAVGTNTGLFGADDIDAGADDDLVFGQLGNDVLRGGTGADYIEGNGGADTMYGGLGQDDLIGGSSDLFGLSLTTQRPDGRDTIYGGDGTGSGRNDAGDISPSGHANDADVILGDNGRIFKMVGAGGQFLTFTYDNYGAVKVIPRAAVLLDYSPTGDCGDYWLVGTNRAVPTREPGTCTNIGGGDYLHGEGGDDVIHGMGGDDALFGDGQDDDLYGEAGNDWVSGGAGTDGIVGDDGLVMTSRNGMTEFLNYRDTATVQQTVAGDGPHHSALINPTGVLTKAVDLEPFYVGYNDVLYGGLGNDFVHGGEGDDAISGGEALSVYYTLDPLAFLALYYVDDNPLQFGLTDPEEFWYYNEANPMRLVRVCRTGSDCIDFLTTADAAGNDGDDALFGDGGSDWMSGGTGVDHLYGGWGNDLLDVDDDKTTQAGANNKIDSDTNADYVFGGAGRDVMIGNTKSDRLIDWIGEYNSYAVPFNPFGASTVWRASSPGVRDFLYLLSKADGSDQTRAPGSIRNGEPYGELGLTNSEDAEWGDQHGAPDDPQPGNGGTFDTSTSTFGTTTYAGSTGSLTTTTTFASTTTTTTAKIASASVTENKKGGTLTVKLAAKATAPVRIAIVVVGLDEVATYVGMITVWTGAISASGTYSLGMVSGGQYEFLWMASPDPTQCDLVLVIRQIA